MSLVMWYSLLDTFCVGFILYTLSLPVLVSFIFCRCFCGTLYQEYILRKQGEIIWSVSILECKYIHYLCASGSGYEATLVVYLHMVQCVNCRTECCTIGTFKAFSTKNVTIWVSTISPSFFAPFWLYGSSEIIHYDISALFKILSTISFLCC